MTPPSERDLAWAQQQERELRGWPDERELPDQALERDADTPELGGTGAQGAMSATTEDERLSDVHVLATCRAANDTSSSSALSTVRGDAELAAADPAACTSTAKPAAPEPPPALPPTKSRKPTVVQLPQKREVMDKHLANLRASGITDETIALASLWSEWDHHTLADLVQRKVWARSQGAALIFPFYLPGATEPHAYRLRPTNPRTEKRGGKKRLVKYDQADAHGMLVYFTPRARAARWYADTSRTLYWTEGEKKALVFDQLELACVGLTGVWNWGDKKHREETGEERPHPAIREHVAIAGRHHVICFDADAHENDQVMLAAGRLCGLLRAAGALSVRFCCPPTIEHKGVDDYYAAFGGEAVRKLLESATDLEPVDPKRPWARVRALKIFADAPVHAEAVIPEGWGLRKDGSLWKLAQGTKQSDVLVSPAPLFILRKFVDHESGEGRAEICYRGGDGWISREVSQLAIGDRHTMVKELTPFCVPVTSSNASRTVDWLLMYERLNAEFIPNLSSFSRVGWHRFAGRHAFVLHEPILPEGKTLEAVVDQRGQRKEIFAALRPRGDLEQHLAALRRAWDASPICAAVVCGALAAPLLKPLGAPNFAIHLLGESSRGKTSMLKIAASVFGDPNDQQWVAAWNTTNVGAELRAASLCDLPQCYDEVGDGDAEQLQRLVYSIVNGTGRARGLPDVTIRPTLKWRTIVLSTGERGLVDETAATGAQVRVTQLHVDGFGKLHADEIDGLCGECAAHAGSFGRAWIAMLLDIQDWTQWQRLLADNVANLRAAVRGNASDSLQGRVAGYFALLQVAEQMSWELGLGKRGKRTMLELFRSEDRRVAVEGQAPRLRSMVDDWIAAEPDSFPELTIASSGGLSCPRPKYSAQHLNGWRTKGAVLLIPDQFRARCSERGFARELQPTLQTWRTLEWLRCSPGRLVFEVRIDGDVKRVYYLQPKKAATDAANDGSDRSVQTPRIGDSADSGDSGPE